MKKILLIEDEISIAELERDYLELSGFEVEIAGDGSEGLSRALKEDFDLFVLDLMLPGIDGFEICRRRRKTSTRSGGWVSARTIILPSRSVPAKWWRG